MSEMIQVLRSELEEKRDEVIEMLNGNSQMREQIGEAFLDPDLTKEKMDELTLAMKGLIRFENDLQVLLEQFDEVLD